MMPNIGLLKQRGFNLIESAVVLGVVGLVIGGIWGAASAISLANKTNRIVNGTLDGVRNIQKLISISDSTAIGNAVYLDANFLISASVFPADFSAGGAITVRNWAVTPRSFDVMVSGLERSLCINILYKLRGIIGSADGSDGWRELYVGSSTGGGGENAWISLTALRAMDPSSTCAYSPSNRIRMRFAYRQIK